MVENFKLDWLSQDLVNKELCLKSVNGNFNYIGDFKTLTALFSVLM